jgi:hypothetical protein
LDGTGAGLERAQDPVDLGAAGGPDLEEQQAAGFGGEGMVDDAGLAREGFLDAALEKAPPGRETKRPVSGTGLF